MRKNQHKKGNRWFIFFAVFCVVATIGVAFGVSENYAVDANAKMARTMTLGDAGGSPLPNIVSESVKEIEALNRNTVSVPILLYHSITEDPAEVTPIVVTKDTFRGHMQALYDAGYQTVSYSDLYAFVEQKAALPEKPVIITFDDGYQNNLTFGAPILKDYGFCAQIAVIGCSLGKSVYKDTGREIIPHFSLQEAEPWMAHGTIHLNSHSFDMHQVKEFDGTDCRKGVLPFEGESKESYAAALKKDFETSVALIDEDSAEKGILVFTYPYGLHHPWSEQILGELGVVVTVAANHGIAQLVREDPQSLRKLPRINVTDDITPEQLLEIIAPALAE